MKSRWFVFLLFAAGILTGCTGQAQEEAQQEEMEAVYHKITPEQAKEMMKSENVLLLDVRTEEEYRVRHIPGAVLLPNDSIQAQRTDGMPDRDKTILVYCRSGHRSRIAAEKLVQMGYTKVYDFGGIIDWPYETEPV